MLLRQIVNTVSNVLIRIPHRHNNIKFLITNQPQAFFAQSFPYGFKIKNVLYLKQPTSGEQFILLNQQRVLFDQNNSVQEWKEKAAQVLKASNIKIFCHNNYSQFPDSIKVAEVVKDDFIIQVNNTTNYSVLANVENRVKLINNDSLQFSHISIRDLTSNLNIPYNNQQTLEYFVEQFIHNLDESTYKQVDTNLMKMISDKIMMNMSLLTKTKMQVINSQLKILQKNYQEIVAKKKIVDDTLMTKSNKRLKKVYAFILAQILFTQYGTYSWFSWDIMEPITCLLGILDIIIAYTFWMTSNKDYDFSAIVNLFIENRESKELKKICVFQEEIEDYQKMIKYLQYKKLPYTWNQDELEKALKM